MEREKQLIVGERRRRDKENELSYSIENGLSGAGEEFDFFGDQTKMRVEKVRGGDLTTSTDKASSHYRLHHSGDTFKPYCQLIVHVHG